MKKGPIGPLNEELNEIIGDLNAISLIGPNFTEIDLRAITDFERNFKNNPNCRFNEPFQKVLVKILALHTQENQKAALEELIREYNGFNPKPIAVSVAVQAAKDEAAARVVVQGVQASSETKAAATLPVSENTAPSVTNSAEKQSPSKNEKRQETVISFGSLKRKLSSAGGVVSRATNTVGSAATTVGTTIKSAASTVGNQVGTVASKVGIIERKTSPSNEESREKTLNVLTKAKKNVASDSIGNTLKKKLNSATGFVASTASTVGGGLESAGREIKNTAKAAGTGIKGLAKSTNKKFDNEPTAAATNQTPPPTTQESATDLRASVAHVAMPPIDAPNPVTRERSNTVYTNLSDVPAAPMSSNPPSAGELKAQQARAQEMRDKRPDNTEFSPMLPITQLSVQQIQDATKAMNDVKQFADKSLGKQNPESTPQMPNARAKPIGSAQSAPFQKLSDLTNFEKYDQNIPPLQKFEKVLKNLEDFKQELVKENRNYMVGRVEECISKIDAAIKPQQPQLAQQKERNQNPSR